jgi:hypothetical protein
MFVSFMVVDVELDVELVLLLVVVVVFVVDVVLVVVVVSTRARAGYWKTEHSCATLHPCCGHADLFVVRYSTVHSTNWQSYGSHACTQAKDTHAKSTSNSKFVGGSAGRACV